MEMSEVPSQPREVNQTGISKIPTCDPGAPGALKHAASPAPPAGRGDLHGPGCPVGRRRAAGHGNP